MFKKKGALFFYQSLTSQGSLSFLVFGRMWVNGYCGLEKKKDVCVCVCAQDPFEFPSFQGP